MRACGQSLCLAKMDSGRMSMRAATIMKQGKGNKSFARWSRKEGRQQSSKEGERLRGRFKKSNARREYISPLPGLFPIYEQHICAQKGELVPFRLRSIAYRAKVQAPQQHSAHFPSFLAASHRRRQPMQQWALSTLFPYLNAGAVLLPTMFIRSFSQLAFQKGTNEAGARSMRGKDLHERWI
eukprot:1158440-Pelagomonas_calceolata.AAC.4